MHSIKFWHTFNNAFIAFWDGNQVLKTSVIFLVLHIEELYTHNTASGKRILKKPILIM